MSVYYTNCKICGDNRTLEDLLLQAFVCDGSGNAYLRTYNPTLSTPFCGQFSDYVASVRNIDGVDHTGLEIIHSLNSLDPLFVTVRNAAGAEVQLMYDWVDANTIFLVTDGAESENMTFCISK